VIPRQAITLALLGSIYPPALAVAIAIAAGEKVRTRLAIFVVAAAATTYVVGLVILELFTETEVSSPRQHSSGVLQFVIGVALVVLGVYLQRRSRRPKPEKPAGKESAWSRRIDHAMSSVPLLLILAVTLYALPSPQYIGAVKAVSGQPASEARKLIQLLVVVAIMLWMIELPALGLAIFPQRAGVALERFNAWLSRNGRTLLIVLCYVAGVWMIINGLIHAGL
jgi:heme/copper-type cytochrome/quinol oxidase subunit 2